EPIEDWPRRIFDDVERAARRSVMWLDVPPIAELSWPRRLALRVPRRLEPRDHAVGVRTEESDLPRAPQRSERVVCHRTILRACLALGELRPSIDRRWRPVGEELDVGGSGQLCSQALEVGVGRRA